MCLQTVLDILWGLQNLRPEPPSILGLLGGVWLLNVHSKAAQERKRHRVSAMCLHKHVHCRTSTELQGSFFPQYSSTVPVGSWVVTFTNKFLPALVTTDDPGKGGSIPVATALPSLTQPGLA